MGGPVAIDWSMQAYDQRGWFDIQLIDRTPFCCHACQDDWIAEHRDALGPRLDRYTDGRPTGTRTVGQPGAPLGETSQDTWCAACGVLIQVGGDVQPCSTDNCPPTVINRFLSAEGERCPDCGRWQQLPANALDRL